MMQAIFFVAVLLGIIWFGSIVGGLITAIVKLIARLLRRCW